ncbi:MAG: hypothetical protein U0869_02795 [Chloroflexota bacterium]
MLDSAVPPAPAKALPPPAHRADHGGVRRERAAVLGVERGPVDHDLVGAVVEREDEDADAHSVARVRLVDADRGQRGVQAAGHVAAFDPTGIEVTR